MGSFRVYVREPTENKRNHYKFIGKERDAESNLDEFGARYYASNMGRFMTPDWSEDPDSVPYTNCENPQTLNLYGYVQNNPLSAIAVIPSPSWVVRSR